MLDFLFGSAFALVAALGVVLCFAVALHWGHHREQGLLPYIYYPAFFTVVVGTLFSGRNLYLPFELQDLPETKSAAVVWASRATSVLLLLAAGERIARRLLHYGPKPDAPMTLILALSIFYVTNVVTAAVFGARASFSHQYVYMALAGFAALLASKKEGDIALRSARNALFIFFILSALCILWRPELVLTMGQQSLVGLRWLPWRYAGLSSHPNTLGPLAIALLLCLWSRPYSRRWLNLAGWTIGGASLLLSQSKTSWIASVLCVGCVVYFRGHDHYPRPPYFPTRAPLLAVSLLMLTLAVGVAIMFGGLLDRVETYLDTREGTALMTLVGRTEIWNVALEEWRNHPAFGYGLTIWDLDYRAQIGIPSATHAHNQLYQSLASAGVTGVVGLTIYTATLLWFVLKTAKASHGLTLALFLLLFNYSISEVPLSMSSYGPPQLMHLLLLMVVASTLALSKGLGTRQKVVLQEESRCFSR